MTGSARARSRRALGLIVVMLTVTLAVLWAQREGPVETTESSTEGAESSEPPPLCTRPGHSGGNSDRHLDAPYVILISFDGFRWDYPGRFETPNFDRVAEAGTRAERLIPIFPTKTFPSHYSIATGMYAETHGLVGNRFWSAERDDVYSLGDREAVEDGSWYRGEPIWVTAERQGMVSASFFFVGSEAAIGGVRPTYCRRFDAGIPNDDRVDGVLGWLRLPPRERPHVVTLYFGEVDRAGHDFGPDSEEMRAAISIVDDALGRLLDGIEALPHGDKVNVVLVSDHGMMFVPAEANDLIDLSLLPGVRMEEGGPYASIFVEGDAQRKRNVRDSLAAMVPLNAVYLREEVPERFRYSTDPNIGDIVIIAAPGRQVRSADRAFRLRDFYNHGWDNLTPEMAGILLAAGPQIAEGAVTGPTEAVHIYPLIAEILGLEPNPEIDGELEAIKGFLRG